MKWKNKEQIIYGIIVFILVIAGISLILFENSKFGAGITPDSISYIREANGILNHERIEYLYWAPLYPILLAAINSIVKIGMQQTILFINVVSFALLMIIVGFLCWKKIPSSIFVKIFCVFLLFFCLLFLPIYQFALTEPIFILLGTLYLFVFDYYITENKIRYVILTAIIMAISCMVRYAGVIFVLVGIVNLFIFTYKKGLYLIKVIGLFSGISLAPLALWLLRNKYLFGSFTGSRPDSAFSYRENIESLIQHLYGWYIPEPKEYPVILLFITIVLVIGVYTYFKRQYKSNWKQSWVWMYVNYIAIYMVLLIPLSSSAFWQLLDDRYLSPLVIPINILLVNFIYEFAQLWNFRSKRFNFGIVIVCLFLLNLIPAKRMIYAILWQYEAGIGYTSNIWMDSETINYLKIHDLHCDIYSNGPDAIYFYKGLEVEGVPNFQLGAPDFDDIEQNLDEWTAKTNKCIVWFNTIERDYLYDINELVAYDSVKSIVLLGDGKIYVFD